MRTQNKNINHITALYVVATPIGNLEDITLRALRILKEVDFILCEDKRITSRLLNKYDIKTKLIDFHKFNESKRIDQVISLIKSGKNIALVSDSGTPLVSDPGSTLVSALKKEKIKTISIPGPSALTAALSVSPLVLNEFLFLGFLPSEKNKRHKILSSLKAKSNNVILFIAPHDFKKYTKEIFDIYPDVDVFYARELTKIYEETWAGRIKDLINDVGACVRKPLRGEIVLGICFNDTENNHSVSDEEIIKIMKSYIDKGFSLKEASRKFAKEHNLSTNKIYDLYIKKRKGNS